MTKGTRFDAIDEIDRSYPDLLQEIQERLETEEPVRTTGRTTSRSLLSRLLLGAWRPGGKRHAT